MINMTSIYSEVPVINEQKLTYTVFSMTLEHIYASTILFKPYFSSILSS